MPFFIIVLLFFSCPVYEGRPGGAAEIIDLVVVYRYKPLVWPFAEQELDHNIGLSFFGRVNAGHCTSSSELVAKLCDVM